MKTLDPGEIKRSELSSSGQILEVDYDAVLSRNEILHQIEPSKRRCNFFTIPY